MSEDIRLLLVEDDEDFAFLLREELSGVFAPKVQVQWCGDLPSALEAMNAAPPDVLLLDLGLPGATGLEAFERINRAFPLIPVVVLTGLEDEQVAVAALAAGAQDYIYKTEAAPSAIIRSLRYAIVRKKQQIDGETERRKMALLEQRQEFNAMLAHDLKNPLLSADRVLEALSDGVVGKLNGEQLDLINQVRASNRQLLDLIQNMVELHRCDQQPSGLRTVRLDVNAFVSSVVSDWTLPARLQKVALNCAINTSECTVLCDRQALSRVIANLVCNALKFTQPGGTVTIRASCRNNYLEMEVEDTGAGIEADQINRLFQRFSQTDAGRQHKHGSGLGLYVCRTIVEQHGGSIQCDSKLGKGTIFAIRLPCIPAQDCCESQN